jgi:hypothetical protein
MATGSDFYSSSLPSASSSSSSSSLSLVKTGCCFLAVDFLSLAAFLAGAAFLAAALLAAAAAFLPVAD